MTTDPTNQPARPPREAAGQALRDAMKGPTGVPWDDLTPVRQELWCENADPVVTAALRALAAAAVGAVARELYRQHHMRHGAFTEWTMRAWDAGGNQYVDRDRWLAQAGEVLKQVERAYRDTGRVVP